MVPPSAPKRRQPAARRPAPSLSARPAPCAGACLELSLRHWTIGQHGVWGGLVAAYWPRCAADGSPPRPTTAAPCPATIASGTDPRPPVAPGEGTGPPRRPAPR